jgi:hypothetical protein
MATYYWLGKQASTGTGNVNIPLNWTTIGPSGASGIIPPSGTTIPGNNDTIIFTRFVGATATYPIFSPGGTLGIGVSGSTAFVSAMEVYPECPVAIGICGQGGIDEPFRSNILGYANLIVTTSSPAVTGAYYIEFIDNKIGAAPSVYDPKLFITCNSTAPRTVRVSGVVGTTTIGYSQAITTNANVYFSDVTLSGNSTLPASLYKALNVGIGTTDNIYISHTAKINSMSFLGNSKAYISPGFGTTGSIFAYANLNPTPQRIPKIDFVVGACGASYGIPKITNINELSLLGGGPFGPIVNVYHGLGITYLSQNGGVLNFVVPPGTTGLMCGIYEGQFDAQANSVLKSEYATLTLGEGTLGSGGSFVIKNQAGSGFGRPPSITLKGRYDVEINPYTETN